MHLAVERGVPLWERRTVTAGLPSWDRARLFLEVVRCGSFRSAADRLGLSIDGVRRRFDDFEREMLDVKLAWLERVHIMFFASRKNLETHGAPRSLDEMRRHRLVLQIADEVTAKEAFESVFPGYVQRDLAVMKTDVSNANHVVNGAGMGVLPTYAAAPGRKIIPFNVELNWSFGIWLSCHATSGHIPRARRMIDWLIEAFKESRKIPVVWGSI